MHDYSVACTVKHHVTRPTSSRRLPQRPPELVSRSATSGSVAVPRITSSLGDRSFAVAAPRASNNLPLALHRVHSVNTFSLQLKKITLCLGFFSFFDLLSFIFNCVLLGALVVFAHLHRRNHDFLLIDELIIQGGPKKSHHQLIKTL